MRRALEDSLRRLKTERIDLYQLHQPDPTVPIADTLGALDELVKAGKVREIGCSNFSAAQLREAHAAARAGAARFVSVQNEYSLVQREPEREVLAECERLGLAFIPYFPLASGLLTGKYRRGRPVPAGSRLAAGGSGICSRSAISPWSRNSPRSRRRAAYLLELAVSWLLSRPGVASVIAGGDLARAGRAERERAGWRLTPAELAEIDAILARYV